MMEKAKHTVQQLHTFFSSLLSKKPEFFGSVEVNFHKGEVPHVNIKESVKISDLDKIDN